MAGPDELNELEPRIDLTDPDGATVAVLQSAPEAEILVGRLRAEGIPAFVKGEQDVYAGVLQSGSDLGGLRVLVPTDMVQQALAVLVREGHWTEKQLTDWLEAHGELTGEG